MATAPIRPLAWEPPYAVGAAQEMAKRQQQQKIKPGAPAVVQQVKDPALLQLWGRLQLQLGCDPWPGNFHMLLV